MWSGMWPRDLLANARISLHDFSEVLVERREVLLAQPVLHGPPQQIRCEGGIGAWLARFPSEVGRHRQVLGEVGVRERPSKVRGMM